MIKCPNFDQNEHVELQLNEGFYGYFPKAYIDTIAECFTVC